MEKKQVCVGHGDFAACTVLCCFGLYTKTSALRSCQKQRMGCWTDDKISIRKYEKGTFSRCDALSAENWAKYRCGLGNRYGIKVFQILQL